MQRMWSEHFPTVLPSVIHSMILIESLVAVGWPGLKPAPGGVGFYSRVQGRLQHSSDPLFLAFLPQIFSSSVAAYVILSWLFSHIPCRLSSAPRSTASTSPCPGLVIVQASFNTGLAYSLSVAGWWTTWSFTKLVNVARRSRQWDATSLCNSNIRNKSTDEADTKILKI